MSYSPRFVFERPALLTDTVLAYSVAEFRFEGPRIDLSVGTPCCTMSIAGQEWNGYYLGDGKYAVRYAFKQAETLSYTIVSEIPGFEKQEGQIVVATVWPGDRRPEDYPVAPNWYTDRTEPELFEGKWQGGKTLQKWRGEVLLDWAERWEWLE